MIWSKEKKYERREESFTRGPRETTATILPTNLLIQGVIKGIEEYQTAAETFVICGKDVCRELLEKLHENGGVFDDRCVQIRHSCLTFVVFAQRKVRCNSVRNKVVSQRGEERKGTEKKKKKKKKKRREERKSS